MKTEGIGQVSLKKCKFLEKRCNVMTKVLDFGQKHCVGRNTFSCAKINLWKKKEKHKKLIFL